MALGIYRMGAIYYKICIDSYEIYLLECFTGPLMPYIWCICQMGHSESEPVRSTLNVLHYKYKYFPPPKYLSTNTLNLGEMYLSTFQVLSKCTQLQLGVHFNYRAIVVTLRIKQSF